MILARGAIASSPALLRGLSLRRRRPLAVPLPEGAEEHLPAGWEERAAGMGPITIVSPVTSVALKPRDFPRMPAAAYAQKLFDYTHGLGLISEKVTTLTTGLPSVTHFYRWDGRSTTGRLEDPNRNIVNTSVYDAYGLLRNPVAR